MAVRAVVYKNLEKLPSEVHGAVTVVDDSTGETEFTNPEFEAKYPLGYLLAVDVPLGNASMIAWIADEIKQKRAGRCQLLLEKFLPAGSHSGDFVSVQDAASLRREVTEAALDGPDMDPDIREFARSVLFLISAAHAERNPIVFV